jgi:hypothetical protein
MPKHGVPWPHAPMHRLSEGGTYFVTVGTYLKAHHFRGPDRLRLLHRGLLTVAQDYGWLFEAWAMFSNHYHFVAHAPPDAPDGSTLSDMLSVLHVETAKWINELDGTPGASSLIQLPRNAAPLPKVVSGAVKLRSPKRCETRARTSGEPISLVLFTMVRAHILARNGEVHLPVQDRSVAGAG